MTKKVKGRRYSFQEAAGFVDMTEGVIDTLSTLEGIAEGLEPKEEEGRETKDYWLNAIQTSMRKLSVAKKKWMRNDGRGYLFLEEGEIQWIEATLDEADEILEAFAEGLSETEVL